MKKEKITLEYYSFSSASQLSAEQNQLLQKALQAAENAHAPYSKFKVGAALELADGTIILGNNQENAAYPSGLCAERVALFAAGANHPYTAIIRIAIVAPLNPHPEIITPPCGSCLQVMAESRSRQNQPIELILSSKGESGLLAPDVSTFLPFLFDASFLKP